jgi:methionyl-tRNA formyltransferase
VPVVLTQPDRPAGRGLKLTPSPVKALAIKHHLPVIEPRSLRLEGKYPQDAADARSVLQQAQIDVLLVAAYGLILPSWVLTLPRWGCLNIHASLLPRWRGAAPIHRAIEAGDLLTGITMMQMDEGLDTGDILRTVEVAIYPADTTASLHDRLAALGASLSCEVLADLGSPRLRAVPQPEAGVNYAHKVEKLEAAIDWSQSAAVLERRIRAFDPFPGASTVYSGELLKVWRAECVQAAGQPGEVLSNRGNGLVVACGDQALRLLELQRPGGKRLPAEQCLQSLWPELGSLMGVAKA